MSSATDVRLPHSSPTEHATPMPPPDVWQAGLLACVLDEIDHGLLLVDMSGRILHSNQLARRELSGQRALCSIDGLLCATQPVGRTAVRRALQDAGRGCRSLVELEHANWPLSLAFVPLASRGIDAVLVMCSRADGCEALTMQMFARARQLTRAEQAVLAQLCAGQRAEEIASQQGVCLSTVRTHIKNVRLKTGSTSIREVVHRVSRMPQLMSALRIAAPS
ncbi:helix-turn-helix transcriptional regulator [Variovorax sp. W2I14]|uniref:helix-turn-helix transcriptional regulator n=1 Tax=Variovorax sp. W2I14 TaxID=3042290 RepID=UPI003D1B38F9